MAVHGELTFLIGKGFLDVDVSNNITKDRDNVQSRHAIWIPAVTRIQILHRANYERLSFHAILEIFQRTRMQFANEEV